MNHQAPVVLVVDDDPSICSSLSRLLRRSAGYQVQTFSSTEQVFTHGRPKGPCCMVLDFKLPHDDGLHFHEMLVRSGINVPVIFISGHASIPISVQAMKSGAIDFLPKPFDANKLLEAIAHAIDGDIRALQQRQASGVAPAAHASLTPRGCREVFAAVTLRFIEQAGRQRNGHRRKNHQSASCPCHGKDVSRHSRRPGANGRHSGHPLGMRQRSGRPNRNARDGILPAAGADLASGGIPRAKSYRIALKHFNSLTRVVE